MHFADAPKAWGRTRTLASGMGVDLVDAAFDGWLSRSELHGLVATCASCRDVPACTDVRATRQAEAPVFCPNKPTLDALRG